MSTKEFLNLTTDQLETIAEILGLSLTHSIPESQFLQSNDPGYSELHFDMSETLEQALNLAVEQYRNDLDLADTYEKAIASAGAYIGNY